MKARAGALLFALFAAAMPASGGTGQSSVTLDCGLDGPLDLALRLDYRVDASRGPLSLAGEGSVTYRRSGDGYAMSSSLRAMGIFDAQQTSDGTVGRDGLVPQSFTQRTSRRPPLRVDFDPDQGQVRFSQTGASKPAPPGVQDRLSLLMQLAWRQRREPAAAKLVLPVAGHHSMSTYVFEARDAGSISLPAGRFDTVSYVRQREGKGDLLELWLAPQLCSLPVRVRFTDDRGTVIDQRLLGVHRLSQ